MLYCVFRHHQTSSSCWTDLQVIIKWKWSSRNERRSRRVTMILSRQNFRKYKTLIWLDRAVFVAFVVRNWSLIVLLCDSRNFIKSFEDSLITWIWRFVSKVDSWQIALLNYLISKLCSIIATAWNISWFLCARL